MASINKITDMIAAIKTIYSYYAKDTNIEVLVKTWNVLLKPYEDEVVEAAFYKCLQTCKVPPTPADVIERITAMHKALEQTDEELWTVYIDALRQTNRQVAMFQYTYVDESGMSQGQKARQKVESIWAGLPSKIRAYFGSQSEMMRYAQSWGNDKDFAVYEKPRFMKAMPIMEKRQESQALALESGYDKFLLEGGV